MVFGAGQPHGVMARGAAAWRRATFPPGQDGAQVGCDLRVAWNTDSLSTLVLGAVGEAQVWRSGAPARVCPAWGGGRDRRFALKAPPSDGTHGLDGLPMRRPRFMAVPSAQEAPRALMSKPSA